MSDNQKLTITLTGRTPVTITKEKWPVIASAHTWDGQYDFQSFRHWHLKVRQHKDGRAIVYGVHTSAHQGESDRRGGEMLDTGANIPDAIQRVAESLEFSPLMAEQCIADLPAVEVDE
jgi:hypothetical protein